MQVSSDAGAHSFHFAQPLFPSPAQGFFGGLTLTDVAHNARKKSATLFRPLTKRDLQRDLLAILVQPRQLDRPPGDVFLVRFKITLKPRTMNVAQIFGHDNGEWCPD